MTKIRPRLAAGAALVAAFVASSAPSHASPEVLNGRYNVL